MQEGKHLILYDGVCGLCNRLNQFVLARDKQRKFLFASLQSRLAEEVLAAYGKRPEDLNTLYVIVDYKQASERILSRSRAVLYILAELGGVWSLARALRILPDFILNVGYNFLAKIRYRIFGKYETCLMPRPEHKDRFLGDE